jgi:hypothetical protein
MKNGLDLLAEPYRMSTEYRVISQPCNHATDGQGSGFHATNGQGSGSRDPATNDDQTNPQPTGSGFRDLGLRSLSGAL